MDIVIGHFTNDLLQKSGYDFFAVNAKTATTLIFPKELCKEFNLSSTTQSASQFLSMTPNEIHDHMMSKFIVLWIHGLDLSHSLFIDGTRAWAK